MQQPAASVSHRIRTSFQARRQPLCLGLGVLLAWALASACAPGAPAPTVRPADPTPGAAPSKPAAKTEPKPAESPAAKSATKPAASPPVAKPTPNPAARRGGTLVFATSKDIVHPNPVISTVSVGQYIKESMYEPLVAYDFDLKVQPNLAESWQVSADTREFTFRLRRGVKFHSGQEMKADDVVWSARHVQNPANAAVGQPYMAAVDRVEKLDDYTVRFTLKQPSAVFLSNIATVQVLPIMPANALQPGQKDVGQQPPAGTGPFKFVSYQPNNETVVERFADYWEGAPYLDKVIFKLIAEEAVRFTALRAGDVHIAERIPVEWVPRVERGEVRGIKLYQAKNSGYQRLAINVQSPIMRDKRVREAAYHAVDRDQVLLEVFAGYGTPVDFQLAPTSIWHKAAQSVLPPRQRDLARARQLLQEAGYQGQELSMVARRGQQRWVESAQRMMAEAGFNVKVEIVESAIHDERESKGQFDLVLTGASLEEDPAFPLRADLYCVQGENRLENESGYCNSEVDKLVDALEVEVDEAKRLDIVKRVAKIVYDDMTQISFGTEARFFASAGKVQDFQPTDGGAYSSRFAGLKWSWLSD